MTSISIVSAYAPYYSVLVEFEGMAFNQLVVSNLVGLMLDDQLQDYANQYQSDWTDLPPTPEP